MIPQIASGQPKIGVLKESRLLDGIVQALQEITPVGRVDQEVLYQEKPTLDALVVSYEDAQQVPPRMYHTPLVLVGTEQQLYALASNAVTEFIPVHPQNGNGCTIDKEFAGQKIAGVLKKTDYVRAVEHLFPGECAPDLTTLQEALSERTATSLFDSYHQYCQEVVKDVFDKFSSISDRTLAKESRTALTEFAVLTKDRKLLDALFDRSETIGLVNGINRLVTTGFGKDILKRAPDVLPIFLAFYAPDMKMAPIGFDKHEHAHKVWHVPGSQMYVKYSEGAHRDSLRHEAKVLGKLRTHLRRVQDNSDEPFELSFPEVWYTPPKSIADTIDYNVLVLSKLPGEQLAAHFTKLHNKMRTYQHAQLPVPDDQKSELKKIHDGALDECAKVTALAYVVSKLEDREPDLIRYTHTRQASELRQRLEDRFLGVGQSTQFREGLQEGGMRKAYEGQDAGLTVFGDTILKHIEPVLEIIADAPPGIDTDRSSQNMLVEPGKYLRFHHVDFETFRNDPTIQSWAHTALLLGSYTDDKRKMTEDYFYGDSRRPLFEQGEEVEWHRYSVLEFLKRVHANVGKIRKAIIKSGKPAARGIRFPLPTADQAGKEFYALSCYRGTFYFGFFERFRELRKNELDVIDACQHMTIGNARIAIDNLRTRFMPRDGALPVLYDGLAQLYDYIVTREHPK